MRFAEMTAPQIAALDRDRTVVVAPLAAVEQHSRHLPVSTDAILVAAVADGLERARPESVLLLPVLWLGASDHHLPFGGTLTASLPVYENMLVELLTPPLRAGFRRAMYLNGHGGNVDPLRIALRRLSNTFPDAILTGAAYWTLALDELAALCRGPRKIMGHACEIETSMVMHLRPDLVREHLIEDDPATTPESLSGLTWARDFARMTDHGAEGHPSFATAESGRAMLEAVVGKVAGVVDAVLGLPAESRTSAYAIIPAG